MGAELSKLAKQARACSEKTSSSLYLPTYWRLWYLFANLPFDRLWSHQQVFKMNMLDLANLLDNDGNMQNEMMVMAFAATLLSTIPVLLGNEFDINVGLRKKRMISSEADQNDKWQE